MSLGLTVDQKKVRVYLGAGTYLNCRAARAFHLHLITPFPRRRMRNRGVRYDIQQSLLESFGRLCIA
jgi:hypothetical protein